MTIYRCMFTTREKRRARTYTYTLAIDIPAQNPEHAKRLLNERWPNHQPLPHRYNNVITETAARRPEYPRFTRVATTYVKNSQIDYLKH